MISTVDLAGVQWHKSSRSGGGENQECVEVAFVDAAVAVRDSKNPEGPALVLSKPAFAALLAAPASCTVVHAS